MNAEEIFAEINARHSAEVVQAVARDPSLAQARDEGLGSTPLVFAAHRGLADVVAALLAAGAAVDDPETASGTTALHWAAEGGHVEVARLLLAAGASLTPADGWFALAPLGWGTVVDWAPAFRADRPAVIALLLAHGAAIDPFSAIVRGEAGELAAACARTPHARLGFALGEMTPLHFAVATARPATGDGMAMIDCLLANGADLQARTASGLTPLAIATAAKQADAKQAEVVGRLHQAGARDDAAVAVVRNDPAAIGAVDAAWASALLFAAAERDAAAVIAPLVGLGGAADGTRTGLISERPAPVAPLHVAARAGHARAVAALLAAGARPDGPATLATPLHLAAGEGKLEAVKLLAEAGAALTATDGLFGVRPAGWAQHGGHGDVVAYLQARGA